MKKLLLFALACFCLASRSSADGSETANLQVLAGPFDWTRELEVIGQVPHTTTGAIFPPDVLPFKAWNSSPTTYTLRTLGPSIVSKITSKHYAIIGHLKYSDVAAGSFLEMENWFAPEQAGGPEGFYYSRTLAEAGPLAKIEGSDDGRDFALPFDATGAKTPLVRLVMKLHVMGPGEFEISNVRLVQYPDESSQTPASPETKEPARMKVLAPLSIEKLVSRDIDSGHKAKVSFPKEADGTTGLLFVLPKWTLDPNLPPESRVYKTALVTVPTELAQRVTGSCYGITGQVSYSDEDPLQPAHPDAHQLQYASRFAVLDMASILVKPGLSAPLEMPFQGMPGPRWGGRDPDMGLLSGTQDWRDFYLGYNRGGNGVEIKRLELYLVMNRPGTVHLRDLRLVQYPEPAPAAVPPPSVVAGNTPAVGVAAVIDKKSFALGALTTLGIVLGVFACFALVKGWRRLRHTRELRRIASLDG